MTLQDLFKAKRLLEKWDSLLEKLTDREQGSVFLLAFERSDPRDFQSAFLNVINEDRLDWPWEGGVVDEETREVTGPFEDESPIIGPLLHNIASDLEVEILIDAAEEIIAARKPAEQPVPTEVAA
jgi:hypothetical protein